MTAPTTHRARAPLNVRLAAIAPLAIGVAVTVVLVLFFDDPWSFTVDTIVPCVAAAATGVVTFALLRAQPLATRLAVGVYAATVAVMFPVAYLLGFMGIAGGDGG